jgi:hypothetical protein
MLAAAVAASVFAGAATQRVTGLGFALVASPLLVLVLGPFQGVLLANVLSLLTNLVVLCLTWRDVELRRTLTLTIPAICLVPVGALVARTLPLAVLQVVVGAMVLVALAASRLTNDHLTLRGTRGAVAAGAASGFMNATAGVGGPALAIYAIGSRWDHRGFVASAQLYFALVNIASIATKGLPDLTPWQLISAALALAAGLGAGQVLAPRLSPDRAMTAVIALAALGAGAAVIRGVAAFA